MDKKPHLFHYIRRSQFVKSVFLQMLSIFLFVSIAIVAIVFYSFASEINRDIIADRQKQLAVIESSISKRLEEISSIAYNISIDPTFHLEPVEGAKYSGYEMSVALSRYLVGNSFIEHLAYHRLSEPDKIYVSSGERSFTEFWSTNLGLDKAAAEALIRQIQSITHTKVVVATYDNDKTYFSYLFPLPQFSTTPQAFVLMLIPLSEVAPLLETQLMDSSGQVAVFDAGGNEVYRLSTLKEDLPLDLYAYGGSVGGKYVADDGARYVIQKQVSAGNGWTYVSIIRLSDIISGLANRQLVFIVLLLALMFVAIFALMLCIIGQYKPISNLAGEVTDRAAGGGERQVIDERALLSSTIATLKDDSAQKQRFETAYHEAEAANKAKSAVLSNVSHDIRTPMNAIIGMTDLASKHADDPDYVRECLQKVQTASQYLLDIINNVLDMSRIESGRFTLSEEVIDLPGLADRLNSILGQSVADKGQRFIIERGNISPANARVIGDNMRLTQVFVNILSNAVKFTPAGGTISLYMRQEEESDPQYGDYIFTFADTGIGMSPEFVGRVFDAFSRDQGADVARIEGTGLGMAIAKNLVELMGGTIRCASELGRGTTFTVCIPMKFAPDASETAALSAPGGRAGGGVVDLEGRRVLVAEDNIINREIARKVIGETKAEIVEAVNGQKAVDAFGERPEGYFDIILMDVQMPVMNGYEATAAIRSLPRADAQTIPIYAMTASIFDEDVRQAQESGMNGRIEKPYTPEALYKLLEQAIAPGKN